MSVGQAATRRNFGWGPSSGVHPGQYGIHAAGRFEQHDRPRETEASLAGWRAYMRAVRRVLGREWPYGAVFCPLYVGVLRYSAITLDTPCRLLTCPDCLVGHIGGMGLPVLYHREMPEPLLTCRWTATDALTLRAIGERVGVTYQRVDQVLQRILRRPGVSRLELAR